MFIHYNAQYDSTSSQSFVPGRYLHIVKIYLYGPAVDTDVVVSLSVVTLLLTSEYRWS